MEISKKRIWDFVSMRHELIIPFYQRNYDWDESNVEKLLEDVINNKNDEYFLGTIVLKNFNFKTTIIDGQQRITTLFLIFSAILENNNLDKDIKIRMKDIFNSFKFTSANIRDENILNKIVRDEKISISEKDKESNYWRNFLFIKDYLKSYNDCIYDIYLKIEKIIFSVVVITDRDDLDEHIVFSQINSTGRSLTSYDLFKNHIFSEICKTLNKETFEKELNNKLMLLEYALEDITKSKKNNKDKKNKKEKNDKKDIELNDILRRFISYLTFELQNKNNKKIYESYKKVYDNFVFENEQIVNNKANNFFDKFYKYARIQKFVLSNEEYKKYIFKNRLYFFHDSFKTYANIIIDIIWKNCLVDEKNIIIDKKQENDIDEALKILQLYKIRRTFCDMKEKNITRFIPTVTKLIEKQNDIFSYAEKLYIILFHNPNNKLKSDESANVSYRMPTINEFKVRFKECNIYEISNKFCKMFLIFLASSLSKADINFNHFTVEHILPQDRTKWYQNGYDGNEDEDIKYVHTIGNLTITPHNSELSNDIFAIKKIKMTQKESFNLTNWIIIQEYWNVEKIKENAERLYNTTNEIFNISNIEKKIEKNLMLIENNKEIDAIDFSEDSIKSILKNQSYFKKVKIFNKEIISKILVLFYTEKKSYENIEEKIFNYNFDGWLVMSILKFLELPTDKNKEVQIDVIMNNEKVNQLIKMHEDLLEGKNIG